MIIVDIIKGIGKAIRERRKRIDKILDSFENLQQRAEGIFSFADTIQEIKTDIAVMKESIGMIKSFFGIYDMRKINLKVKKDRRKQCRNLGKEV
jgi:hypothetical protein